MEKKKPNYDLAAIKLQMGTVEAMVLTRTARNGIKKVSGLSLQQAWQIIQGLTQQNFYKSMTVYGNNKVWQDVYRAEWQGVALYIKFQRDDGYFIVSFKGPDNE
jgi:motility quorum-sensing regulator / GCU-specific mRNA interferase toxin